MGPGTNGKGAHGLVCTVTVNVFAMLAPLPVVFSV